MDAESRIPLLLAELVFNLDRLSLETKENPVTIVAQASMASVRALAQAVVELDLRTRALAEAHDELEARLRRSEGSASVSRLSLPSTRRAAV